MSRAASPLLPTSSSLASSEERILTIRGSLVHILKRSKINVLLAFIPFGILAGVLQWSSALVFWINFLAILPLADMLGHCTEEIASKTSESVGAILNATFGNAVELIVSVMALRAGLIKIVQTSLLGSILANLLLVNGFCFFLGGLRYSQQRFNSTAANTSTSLLALSVMSLLIPAAFVASQRSDPDALLNLSHFTALILLIVYFLYLIFQFKTHAHLYRSEEEEEEGGTMTTMFASLTLVFVTLLISFHSDFMVGSIEGLTEDWGMPQSFVGIILLPIVGDATEHLSALTMARKNKMNLAISISIGSSTQIALFVIPLMVVMGWILNQPMTLFFETFETAVLTISVLIVNFLIQDGESNWLEGAMLLASYGIIGIAFFFHP